MTLQVTCHEDPAAFAILREEWLALDERTWPAAPFTSPDWCSLWWQHMRRERSGMRDHLRLFELRRANGSLAGIAPMMLTNMPGSGPLRLAELQFIGADANMTEIRGPVCAPEDHTEVVETLARELMRRSGEWHWLRWAGLACEPARLATRLGIALERPMGLLYMLLPLKASWEEFRAGLPRNIRESLRKCYNAPKRDGIDLRFRVVEGGPGLLGAVQRFRQLHRMRARHPAAIAHPDVFDKPRARDFLLDFAHVEAGMGRLRIFEVLVGDVVVASRVGFTRGDWLYLYYSGYDPALARYGVMTRAVAESLKWAIAQGFKWVNLSTGRDVSKTRWRPGELPLWSAVQVAPGIVPRLGFRATTLARRVVHAALDRSGAA